MFRLIILGMILLSLSFVSADDFGFNNPTIPNVPTPPVILSSGGNASFNQSALNAYIAKNGSTTTTGRIPFAQGTQIGTGAQTQERFIIQDSTLTTYCDIYSLSDPGSVFVQGNFYIDCLPAVSAYLTYGILNLWGFAQILPDSDLQTNLGAQSLRFGVVYSQTQSNGTEFFSTGEIARKDALNNFTGAVNNFQNITAKNICYSNGTGCGTLTVDFTNVSFINNTETLTGNKTYAKEVRGTDIIYFNGTLGQGGNYTGQQNGTVLLWWPFKSAFRAGNFSTTDLNFSNIGVGSFATGGVASGIRSTSLGTGRATGTNSLAVGACNASGTNSACFGPSTSSAQGSGSIVFGATSRVLAARSVATGQNNYIDTQATDSFITGSGNKLDTLNAVEGTISTNTFLGGSGNIGNGTAVSFIYGQAISAQNFTNGFLFGDTISTQGDFMAYLGVLGARNTIYGVSPNDSSAQLGAGNVYLLGNDFETHCFGCTAFNLDTNQSGVTPINLKSNNTLSIWGGNISVGKDIPQANLDVNGTTLSDFIKLRAQTLPTCNTGRNLTITANVTDGKPYFCNGVVWNALY